jgi:hypothetical protein
MKTLGRGLQLVGLIALPLGMVLELTGGLGRAFGLSQMVFLLAFGVIAFVLGRYLEGYART